MTEDRENSEEEPMDEGRFFDGDSSNTYDDPSRDDEDEEYSNSNSEGFESSYQSGSDDGSSYRSVENDGSVTSFDGIGDDLEKRKENEESFTDRCKDSYLENANAFRQQNFHGKEDRESLVDLKFGSSSSEKVDPFFSENRSKEYTEGNTNYKGSQSDGGRQVSENEESDDDDDGTSQSHSSRSKGSETNIVSKEESKDSFYEWGSFRSEDKRSVSLGDADSVDNSETLFCLKRPSGTKTNDDIDQPLFSLPARFQDPFFHNVDKKGTSFDRKNNFTKADGFDVAFGSNPFGGKQESQKDYYFDSEYNEHSQVSGTATAACGVYPLAKGGLSQNGFSAFDEHSQSSSNSVSDEDEGDFLMEEKLIEPDPLHPGNEKSRKNSSHVANEEEPLFGTKSESADREIEREREMLFSYSAHDDNHDVQFLGDCVVDMNQMGEDQEQNNKPDNRHASSENLKVDNADEGESSSDADNGVPLDRDENSDTSYFEKKESRPHHGRDEEDFDAGEESEASSPFQSSHTGSESDTSFKSNDEESRSSHQKETSFVSQSNTDIVSHPIPHGGDNSRSTNADDEAMEPLDNDNEPWHASFSASEQSRSTSLNEDTDESSSNSEDLESESHIDERDESFNPFFPSDEHFNSKPLLVDKSNKSDDVSVDSHENSRLGSSSGANGNEQWHASFTASEQSRSTPHNEDTDESSSRSENSEPESHIDEEDGSFSPFFPSDVHFNSKPLLVDESNKSDDVSVDSHENSRLGSSSGANGNEQWHASFTASEQSRSTSLEEGTDGSSRSEKPESESDIDEEDESFSPFFPSDVHFNSKPLLVDKSNKSDDVSVDSNEKSRSGSSGGANNESESSAFDSSQHADSVSSKDEVDESYSSSSDPSESSESLLEEVEQPFNTFSSEHNRADAEESWLPNDGDNDPSEVRSIEEAEESNSSSFEGSSHSGLRSFEDDASSSRGAAFDDSERSSSKSPSSESSRSRRAEVEKFDNASFENSAHSQAKSLKDANELSWNPKFNDNENPKASVPSFEGDESASWDTAVDDSVYYSSASLKQGTNESCSVSGFDSSEFSRSLRIEAKESFLPFVENSDKETSNSVLETSEVSRSESSRDKMHGSWHRPSEQLKIFGSKLPTGQSDGSWNSAFETSKLSGTESIKEEANESISTSSKTSHDSRPESSKSSDSADKSLGSRSNFTRDESNPSSKSDADNSQGSISKSTKDKSDQFFHASFEHSDHEQARSAEYGPQESMNSDDDEHSQAKVLQIDAERSRNASPDTSDHSKTGSSKNVANESHAGNFFSDNLDENSSHESSHTDSVVSGIIRESGTSDRESERPSLYKNSKLSGTDEETSDRSSKNSISNSDEGVENNGVELISNVPKADEANESATFDSRKDAKSTSSTQSRSSQDGGEDEDSSSGADPQQQKHKKDRDTSSKSEVSMMIGDVFGQPNELFEDFNRRERSSKSSELTDYMLMRKEAKDLIISESNNETDPKDTFLEAHENKFEEEENALNHDTQTKKEKIVISEKERRRKRKRKKQRRRRKKEAKSAALLDFAANVNETIFDLEDRSESDDRNVDSAANSLLHGFDALLGIFLQLSDELELIATFSDSNRKDEVSMVHVSALTVILGFAETFDQLFADLKPIILESFEEEPDEYMDDLFQRLDALVDLLCETSHRVGEKQEWNCRAETTYVTLLELIERDSLDLRCYFDDVDTPDPGISANVHEAWSATGHIEELKAIQRNDDPELFRQICYEVLVSTDQWCPDTDVLMEICGIDPDVLNEEPPQEDIDDDELAPIPQAAEHILDKVNGDTLPRLDAFTSILRRILPPRAVTDTSLLSHFTSVRNAIESPLGLSATNVVSISSVPESINDPNALGVAGVGKTTLAAMVAEHRDVRRHFIDGVVWVYLGNEELNYNRYTQCLRELVAQLDFYDGIPLFAELLHTPGENPSKRRRREEGFMIYARDTIAGLLKDRSVLIILDDVCFEPDMDWFDFAPMPDESTQSQGDNCALVITTRRRSLLPAADTVEIDMLDEADAITLLIQESGQLSHTLMAESKEARSVVRECANHPLAVKSIGRWLNLKHATAGAASSVEEIHSEVIKSMDKILKAGDTTGTDMMYEILSTSLSPAINGGPTNIIKFCFAAFIMVFCDRNHISEFELTEPTPIVPMDIAELLFQTLLEMYEVSLLQKGSLFHAQKKEAAVLIPEALSALGVLKVITYTDNDEEEDQDEEQKFLQVMHSIHLEYGVYLAREDLSLKDFTKDAERQWNRALVDAYQSRVREWDWDLKDAAHGYALEMIVSHMIRGTMYNAAATLLAEQSFIRGRLLSLGRENCTKRHIKDCEMLCEKLKERMPRDSKLKPRSVMKNAYQALGRELAINADKNTEDKRVKNVEVARAHYEIGFSLAENRCWDAAIAHWETSQELLMSALGLVEVVAGILYNIGVIYSELNEYEQALNGLKQCLKIRATIHGEEHVLYAQSIQKIGDVLLNMSDYHEAMESYNWALDVMYKEPDHHYIEIGEILDNKGTIHYSKGEVDEALQCHQEALRSKQEDLGEDHPELAATYHHIGNCLSDQGNIDDAIVHFEEAIRLKELDPEGGPENDAEVLTIEGILNNLEGNQEQGLECYEKSLQILVTKVPYRKEKIASLLHLIGCVYLMSGEQRKAMKLFEESLQARRKVLGFVHLDVASTLFNMAFLHQTRNRLDKALRCLEEALKIRQLRLPDSEKVAVTHEKIGSLARGIGKAKKAQIAFEEALKIRKSIHGKEHEAVATVLQELGDLMDDLGEYESSMNFYVEALEIRRNRLGLDDIAVAETLYSMGYSLHNSDETDRALVCFVEALSIRRFQLGEDSMEVGDTLNMMGFLKAKRGELDDALTLLWDALKIRKLQEDHIKVSETLKNIGNIHREKEESELALECYEECLRIRRLELGPQHEKVADVLIAMGNVHSENPLQAEEAKQSYQEALDIRKQVFGEHDESVAIVLQHMGTIEFRANNYDRARDLLSEFIRIRRDNGTHNDGDYVNVLFMVGNIHKTEGNEAEAKLYWNEAYQVFQEGDLSGTNPQLAEAMKHLVEEDKIDEHDTNSDLQGKKSLFGIVTERFKKDKSEDILFQNGRKSIRRKGKGLKL